MGELLGLETDTSVKLHLETLTGIPGAGLLAVQSINNRDYEMIMAIVMIGASAFVLMSIAIDIAYTLIDPRVRLGGRN